MKQEAQNFDLYGGSDPRDIPAYAFADASKYLEVPLATIKSWVKGRMYPTEAGQKRFEPVFELPSPKKPLLSFTNLVEIHVLYAIRKRHNVRLDKVRDAIKLLEKTFKSQHPLADYPLRTNDIDLFIEHLGSLVNITRGGQLAMKEVMEQRLKRIERDPAGRAARLYPFLRNDDSDEAKFVVIDPYVSFGKPILTGTGIPTAVIAERFDAGESIAALAYDYGITADKIEEAIRYELAA